MSLKHLHNSNKLCTMILLLASLSFGQTTKQDSIWNPFMFFIGNWVGKGEGDPGKANYERTYKFIYNNKFIQINNKSIWIPTQNNPKGEVHEDIGYISYDKLNSKFILRQFHIEGFINQYKLDSISTDGKRITFVSESIENIKSGWRAKESYQILNDHELIEIFELAPPNKDFEVYSKATLKKVD